MPQLQVQLFYSSPGAQDDAARNIPQLHIKNISGSAAGKRYLAIIPEGIWRGKDILGILRVGSDNLRKDRQGKHGTSAEGYNSP